MPSWLLCSLALITFANRYAFLSKTIRFSPGLKAKQFLSYSSYAVLTAIWTPLVFDYKPGIGMGVAGLDYLIAVSLAAILSLSKVRSIIVVLTSTSLFFLLRFFVFV